VINRILQFFSALFNGGVSLFAFGLGAFALSTGAALKLTMLPWFNGPNVAYWLLGIGCVGALASLLSLMGKAKWLLVLSSLFIAVVFIHGHFVGPHSFGGAQEAKNAAYMAIGTVGSFLSSLAGLKKQPRRRI
jgi:hypothetical protein